VTDEIYMQRCLDLAKLGILHASPNPMVGCVLVKDNRIIGEGYHKKYGENHAEVNAVASVMSKADLIGATAYVCLEPCAHFGKTPPCANLLINHQIKKVVVCNRDPFSKVNGKGFDLLKEAGIEVKSGILEKKGFNLNKRFFTYHTKKRPYIILKWAQSKDGFMAPKQQDTIHWITGNLSQQIVHQWRAEEDSILVGRGTVEKDNPSLTVRLAGGRNPTRVILDSHLTLEDTYRVFDGSVRTVVLNTIKSEHANGIEYIQSDMSVTSILEILYQLKQMSVFIEGGSQVLNSFLSSGLWDEARVFTGNSLLMDGIKAPKINTAFSSQVTYLDRDQLNYYEHA